MEKDRPDVIVIRRNAASTVDQPKTGVWKIAHADFMTAMMALFLVLWLVNSTNRETRTTVAQYFNPIKLSDTTSDRKGVRNPQDAEPGAVDQVSRLDGDQAGAPKSGTERRPSAALKDPKQGKAAFEDPYAVLAEVAAAKPEPGSDRASTLTLGAAGKPGMNGGEALRDPFDPNFWRQTPQSDKPSKQEAWAGDAQAGKSAAPAPIAAAAPPSTPVETAKAPPATAGEQTASPPQESRQEAAAIAALSAPPTVSLPMTPRSAAEAVATARAGLERVQANDAAARAIASAIADGKAARPGGAPEVEVRQTDEGVLISLTDNVNFGMFAIGSAEPQPETIEVMQRVAAVLGSREGAIIIRGHTDARRFRDPRQNNWRLSMARADIARDLLVQGGIPEERIEHIEGHSSRKPRAGDPNAAENRRIEILIREKKA